MGKNTRLKVGRTYWMQEIDESGKKHWDRFTVTKLNKDGSGRVKFKNRPRLPDFHATTPFLKGLRASKPSKRR